MALCADGPQHQYRFTMDDQQGTALRGTALRDSTSPRRGCEGIVGVVEIKNNNRQKAMAKTTDNNQ